MSDVLSNRSTHLSKINLPETFQSAVGAAEQLATEVGNEKRRAEYEKVISTQLLRLRTAYPTQARNFTTTEAKLLSAMWMEIFAEVPAEVLQEAVSRHIKNDRTGFFPTPGQIMGEVEKIIAERRAKQADFENYERAKRLLKKLREE